LVFEESLSDLYDRVPDRMIASLAKARRNLTKSNVSAPDFTDILHRQRLVQLAIRVQGHLSDL
jgi:hypothetical protein